MTTLFALAIRAACAACCLVTVAATLAAQGPPGPRPRVFTLVAIPDEFPYLNSDAVVVRRANVLPHDVILLRPGRAAPALLAEALTTLQAVRERNGDVPTADALIRVHPPAPKQRHAVEAERWMSHLSSRDRKEVRGFGKGVAIGLLLRTDEVKVRSNR